MDKLERKYIGTRVSFVLAAILCYFGTLFVITTWGTQPADPANGLDPLVVLDQGQVWTALEWLIAAIGAAVLGDTLRPSGQRQASFDLHRSDPVSQ